jgi:hypothetical protein
VELLLIIAKMSHLHLTPLLFTPKERALANMSSIPVGI